MENLLIKGVVTGFILSIMVGPVFFVLLETSIRRGIRAAVAFDVGVLFSDAIYILIAYLFYSEVSSLISGHSEGILQLVGGILFLIYGLVTFFKKPKGEEVDEIGNTIQKSGDYVLLFIKGFLLNFANPMVIFYWFSVITLGAKGTPTNGTVYESTLFFVAVILTTFFSFDLLKIIGAKKLRPLVTQQLLVSINRFIGIIFMIFAMFLIFHGIFEK